jgi:Tfp pilus assembly protein PilF
MRSDELVVAGRNIMKAWLLVLVLVVIVGLAGCAKKGRPLVPLALDHGATPQAVTLTEQGTQAYQARQFDAAKQYFSQALAADPQSGQAHYNYALTLNALGDVDDARQHFIEAANLAPGDKTIWDSPALHQYGNPQTEKVTKEHRTTNSRPTFGGGPR